MKAFEAKSTYYDDEKTRDKRIDIDIKMHDGNIRRHEIGKMKALMRKYSKEAVEFMLRSNLNGAS